MKNSDNPATAHLIYEVDDTPPLSVSLPLAAQAVADILAGITLTPIIATESNSQRSIKLIGRHYWRG